MNCLKIFFGLMLVVLAFFLGCDESIDIDPRTSQLMIVHRNVGLAYLEENKLDEAAEEFRKLSEIAPWEPLGFTNLGLTYLRRGELDEAAWWFNQSLSLVSRHPETTLLLAMAYEGVDRKADAISSLEDVLTRFPDNVRVLYQLGRYYITDESADNLKKAEIHLGKVVNSLPGNIAARLDYIELLLRNGNHEEALQQMEMLRQVLPEIPEGALTVFEQSLTLLRDARATEAFAPMRSFHNLMRSTAFYQAAIAQLKGIDGSVTGMPVDRFYHPVSAFMPGKSRLPGTLQFTDVTSGLGFEALNQTSDAANNTNEANMIFAAEDFDGDDDPDIFLSRWNEAENRSRQYFYRNDNGVFSDVAKDLGIAHGGRDFHATFADYDNDGYLDLFVTNAAAHRLYKGSASGVFTDVSKSANIVTDFPTRSAFFADLDLEGDLDLLIAGESGVRFFRNNLDGSFEDITVASGIGSSAMSGSRDAAFGDFDDDGDVDIVVANENSPNRMFDNLRQSYFRDISEKSAVLSENSAGAITVGDYNNDGYLDFFLASCNGSAHRLMKNQQDGSFAVDSESDSVFAVVAGKALLDARFFDMDNDGYLDLLTAGIPGTENEENGLWLFYNDGKGKFLDATSLLPPTAGPTGAIAIADYDNDGDMDILRAGSNNGFQVFRNDGGNVNNFLKIRLAGVRTGSGKNNFFGLGAKVEMKAGALYQMKVMDEAIAHFGLGPREAADVVRIVWSNGVPQNRFSPERNQTIVEEQILKGSCPWLYAWNGEKFDFVTDVLWASALGMPLGIMSGEMGYAFSESAAEHMKIPGDKLAPRDGKYELRFTTELWETPYLDEVKLLVVDHPDSVEIFVDETFYVPPFPKLRVYSVANQQAPLSATDDRGNDLREKIARRDGDYVSHLTPDRFQGVTRLHDLVLDLGDLASADSIFLFLDGWLFPTDASINVNMTHNDQYRTIMPYLQVINARGEWETVISNIGFPKGKFKTMIIDLSERFLAADYRVRIRTNMQIYWDHVFFATRVSGVPATITTLAASSADLRYRGFSKVSQKNFSSPHLPDYYDVDKETRWRDLLGTYTRHGDILPLLEKADNKYAIMNAGDEVALTFDVATVPDLPEGWKRDFLFFNDGWLKDGDLNTFHGQTAAPLPFHGMSKFPYRENESYPTAEEYQRYQETYNTREVTAEPFKRQLYNAAQNEGK